MKSVTLTHYLHLFLAVSPSLCSTDKLSYNVMNYCGTIDRSNGESFHGTHYVYETGLPSTLERGVDPAVMSSVKSLTSVELAAAMGHRSTPRYSILAGGSLQTLWQSGKRGLVSLISLLLILLTLLSLLSLLSLISLLLSLISLLLSLLTLLSLLVF